MGVVEPFDVVEDGHAGVVAGGEAGAVQEFGFRVAKNDSAGVVVGVASASHRDFYAGPFALGPGCRGVLAATVGLVDQPLGSAASDGHVQGVGYQGVVRSFRMDQPTTRLDQTSMTAARYKNPALVGI